MSLPHDGAKIDVVVFAVVLAHAPPRGDFINLVVVHCWTGLFAAHMHACTVSSRYNTRPGSSRIYLTRSDESYLARF